MLSKFYQTFCNSPEQDFISDLPQDILILIFSYLSSHKVAACRMVCKRFNKVGKRLLNRRFSYYCIKVPKMLLALRKPSVFPSDIHREGNLQMLSSGLLLLRAVFGRYISIGHCCFYPGLILDYIETISSKLTQKRRLCSNKANILKKTEINSQFHRSIHTYIKLIQIAADDFEKRIEPLLPPPRTFVGTKILDLLATSSELQTETSTISFFHKVAKQFPKRDLGGMFINRWLKQHRADLIQQNLRWIYKTIKYRTAKDLTNNQIRLRWNESRKNLMDINETKEAETSKEQPKSPKSLPEIDAEIDKKSQVTENEIKAQKGIEISSYTTDVANNSNWELDHWNSLSVLNLRDCKIIKNPEDVSAINEDNKNYQNKYSQNQMNVINDWSNLKHNKMRQEKKTNLNILSENQTVLGLINNPIKSDAGTKNNESNKNGKNVTNEEINSKENENNIENGFIRPNSKTKKILAEAESLLCQTRELAKEARDPIRNDFTNQISPQLSTLSQYNNALFNFAPHNHNLSKILEMVLEDEQSMSANPEDDTTFSTLVNIVRETNMSEHFEKNNENHIEVKSPFLQGNDRLDDTPLTSKRTRRSNSYSRKYIKKSE